MGDEVSPKDVELVEESGEEVDDAEELGMYDLAKTTASEFLDDRWFNAGIALITAYALFGDDFRLAVLPKSVDGSEFARGLRLDGGIFALALQQSALAACHPPLRSTQLTRRATLAQHSRPAVFVTLSFVCFILFVLEQLLRCWAKTEFLCGPGSFDDEEEDELEAEDDEEEEEGRSGCLCQYRGYLFGLYFWLDLLAAISLIPEIPFLWTPIEATIAPIFDTSSQASQTLATTRAVRASRIGSKAGRVIRIVRLARAVKLFKILTAR